MWLPFGDKQATSGAAGVLCDSGAGQSDLAFWIFSLRSPRRTPLLRIAEEPLHLGPLCLELCPKHREAETPMSRALAARDRDEQDMDVLRASQGRMP
jgi:hypothetical protein